MSLYFATVSVLSIEKAIWHILITLSLYWKGFLEKDFHGQATWVYKVVVQSYAI